MNVWRTPKMTTQPVRKIQLVWVAVAGLGLFAGLCSIFVLVVTMAQGWQEHTQGAMAAGDSAHSKMRRGYLHA
jgi:hypothetical protein